MSVGLEEQEARSHYSVFARQPGLVEVRGVQGSATLTLFDAQGRMLSKERIGSSRAQVACPSGLVLWTLSDEEGTLLKGKVVVR
ncbi:MAG TPA: hypothetical protein PLE78_15010, partial [Flavobacteriales bacterium]|nr:hypothetical protein [Flavobacteriales bacterium]